MKIGIGITPVLSSLVSATTSISLSGSAVAEDATDGVVIAVLSVVGPDFVGPVTFVLISDISNNFEIVGNELRVKTGATLDRETNISHIISIQATDSNPTIYNRDTSITVTNINEQPTDIILSGPNSIPENTQPGSIIGVLSTIDVDIGDTFIYTIDLDVDSKFAISGNNLTVRTGASFDFETDITHNVTVRSTDSGSLFTTKIFAIGITDVNEAPTDITLATPTLAETILPGAVISAITSSDPDTGDTKSYSIISDPDSKFAISGNNLTVRAGASFDVATAIFHLVTIRVTDSGSLTYDEQFSIAVTEFLVTEIVISDTTVAENGTGGELIGTLSISGPDFIGPVSYVITSDPSADFEITAGDEFHVKAATSFDRETQAVYPVGIEGTDSTPGTPLVFIKTINVAVTNVNEQPTDIALSGPNSIPENTLPGSIIGVLSTTDVDVGDTFTYTIDLDADSKFAISVDNLNVRAGASFDFETANSHNVTVRSTDALGLFTTKIFAIGITDIVEAITDIDLSPSAIDEDASPGDTIGTLSSVSTNVGSAFTYTIILDADNKFEIAGDQCKVRAGASFDHETDATHACTVRSTSVDNPAVSFDEILTINVNDINEAPTDITFTGSLDVPEDAVDGTIIISLATTDPDVGDTHTYTQITASSDFETTSAGAVKVKTGATLTVGGTTLTLRTTDSGTPGLTRQEDFIINVTAAGGASLGVTWNPADKSPSVVLSNGDLTMTSASGGQLNSVRTTHEILDTEKKYWELAFEVNYTGEIIAGIANTTHSLTTHPGATANGFGLRNSGTFNTGYTLSNAPGGFSTPATDYWMFARDGDDLYLGLNGTWLGSPTPDPGAGTNPNVTGIGTVDDIYPCAGARNNITCTLRATSAEFEGTIPTGFSELDEDLS